MITKNSYVCNFYFRLLLKIVLFLALFTYIYPIEFRSFPLSPLRLFQAIGFISFIIHIIEMKRINVSILHFYKYGNLIFMMGFFSTILNDAYEFQFALRGIYIYFFIFLGYFIVTLMIKTTKKFSLYIVLEWMVFVTVVQALLSFTLFFSPNLLSLYNDLVVIDTVNEDKLELLNSFRLIGIGAVQYATAAVQYGIMLWTIILLHKQKESWVSRHKIMSILIMILFCIAGILSGRTFFLMLFMTPAYIIYINGRNSLYSSIKYLLILILLLSVIGGAVAVYLYTEYYEIFNWVFEVFINMNESGYWESASTDQLQGMYIFPDNILTWLLGDGRVSNGLGFYMNTDVGYIRSIFYWGILGSIVYYYTQYKYYLILKENIYDDGIRKYIYYILLWFFIYNLKDFWRIDQFFALFLMGVLYSNNHLNNKMYHKNGKSLSSHSYI